VRCAVVPTASDVDRLARTSEAIWTEFGARTLLWAEDSAWDGVRQRTREANLRVEDRPVIGRLYLISQVGKTFQQNNPDIRIVLDKGRYLVADLTSCELKSLVHHDEICWLVRPLPANVVVVKTRSLFARAPVPWVQALVSSISQPSYTAYLTWLAGLFTRHSLSADFVTAANWARDELNGLGYVTSLVPVAVPGGTSYNVIADRTGGQPGSRQLVVVTAHLDSINFPGGAAATAPGADDNGSGSAGVLEIARVLASHPAGHDLRLILFGGEEQGLHGSVQHVASLTSVERARIRAVINMDMVATLNTAAPTVLLEGAAVSQGVMDNLAEAAATYTTLTVETSLNPFASDHVPFINASIPAVLTIEGSDSANGHVHTANDTMSFIDYGLAMDIVRLNVAAAADALEITDGALGPLRASGPVVAWGANRLDAFVIGTDSALYHKWWDGTSWGPSITDYEYMGGICTTRPEAVAWGPNRLDVFLLGTDHALYHKWWDGASWGPSITDYEYMGGICLAAPKAVAWGQNRLDVFVLGTDSAVYHKWWDGANWGPSVTDYEYQGGICTTPPDVVAWGPNRLDVFVLGTDHALYHKWWDGASWGPSLTDWEYLGGTCASAPKAVAWGPNRLDIFVLGMDLALYHKWWDGANWGPSPTDWEYMGGICASEPAVVAWGANRLDVFLLGTDLAIYHKWWDGANWGPSLTGYEYMGGICSSPPRVTAWGPNRLDVFVRGTDHALYHKWWDGATWGPSITGYEYQGGVISLI
jgi:Peptidase family M28/Repeat of unknown function (DUF346)